MANLYFIPHIPFPASGTVQHQFHLGNYVSTGGLYCTGSPCNHFGLLHCRIHIILKRYNWECRLSIPSINCFIFCYRIYFFSVSKIPFYISFDKTFFRLCKTIIAILPSNDQKEIGLLLLRVSALKIVHLDI